MWINNHLQLLEKIYKRKERIPDAYKVDKKDVDSYFFYNFLDICVQNNRILIFSKGFDYATFSNKKIKYDDYITKQSFDLSSELHINKYEFLFILNSVPQNFRTVQKTSTSELYSNSWPHSNHFICTKRVVFPLLYRLQFWRGINSIWNSAPK